MNKAQDIFSLQDKVAVITGGTRGLGASIAELFLDAGAKVVITGRDEIIGKKTAESLSAEGGEVRFVAQDVALEAGWEPVIKQALSSFGGLDILVNNAALHWLNTLEKETLESFRAMQHVNVEGTFLGMKNALAAMKPGGPAGNGGAIINISSIAGLIGFVSHGAYGASKGSVRTLSKVAAMECAHFGYGIRVKSIHPGVIPTDMVPEMWKEIANIGMAADEKGAR